MSGSPIAGFSGDGGVHGDFADGPIVCNRLAFVFNNKVRMKAR